MKVETVEITAIMLERSDITNRIRVSVERPDGKWVDVIDDHDSGHISTCVSALGIDQAPPRTGGWYDGKGEQ